MEGKQQRSVQEQSAAAESAVADGSAPAREGEAARDAAATPAREQEPAAPQEERAARQEDPAPEQPTAGEEEPAAREEEPAAREEEPAAPAAGRPEDAGPGEDALTVALRERAQYLELAQRTQADFENYRKRAAKEAAAAGQRAKSGLVGELLPVVDNLERALRSAPQGGDQLADGVRLVHSELIAVLQRNGVEQFDPAGERFDPSFHEALSTREQEGAAAGVILDVVEKGYSLNGSVLRPARVIVSG